MKTIELRRRLRAKKETREVDYKETLDVKSKERLAGIAKDVAAFANTIGGVIIIGVRDKVWDLVGVSAATVAALTPEDLDNKISNYLDPRVEFDVSPFTFRKKRFVAIEIPKSLDPPHLTKKDGTYPVAKGRSKSAFSKGAIFVRHGAKSEPATRRDLERMIQERLIRERQTILEGVQKVVEAGSGAEVLVRPAASVRVTTDPDAPAVRAVLDTSRIDTVDEELTAAAKLWNTDREALLGEHQLYRFYAARDDLNLDSERAGFLLRSSLAHHLPGCYWASQLDAQFLKDVLSDVGNAAAHPADRESLKLVYLIGGEFARENLSNAAGSSKHVGAKKFAERLMASCGQVFQDRLHALTHQDSTTVRFRVDDNETIIAVSAALKKKAAAKQLVSKIANELAAGVTPGINKAALKRLDIGIYARDLKGKSG